MAHADLRGNGRHTDVAAKMKETRDAISEAALSAKEVAETFSNKILHDTKGYTKEVQDKTLSYVKKNPLKALGWAAAGGFLLSWLLRK